MKLFVGKAPLGRILRWSQRALLACAVLLLGYCAFALTDAWIFQRRADRELAHLLQSERTAHENGPQTEPSALAKGAPAEVTGDLIGRMEIRRLQLSVIVVEGIGRSALRRAVGHIPGTALPGQRGNVGLAGHRDTLFRPLKDLHVHDEIDFSTLHGNFKYEVESLRVVDADDVGVLAPSEDSVLTMVTCYPFYYVGPAPKRWIVRARQVSALTFVRSPVE